MAVKIGHAVHDERGRGVGGKLGDQTKKEVLIAGWYDRKSWSYVLRCKDAAIADKIAANMEAACKNDNIGYDRDADRTSMYKRAKEAGSIAAIKTPCATDCSACVDCCTIFAGITVPSAVATSGMLRAYKATGKFDVLTGSQYLKRSDYLRRGDILLAPGHHTAIVLSDGDYAYSASAGKYVFASNLKRGMTGSDDVRELKKLLAVAGYDSLDTTNGNYLTKTEQVVREYQRKTGLKVDGIAGKQTITALGGVWAG